MTRLRIAVRSAVVRPQIQEGTPLSAAASVPDRCAGPFSVSAIDFFQHINLVYGTISEYCTSSTCPDMNGPCQRWEKGTDRWENWW